MNIAALGLRTSLSVKLNLYLFKLTEGMEIG